jgi:hypothetical protein
VHVFIKQCYFMPRNVEILFFNTKPTNKFGMVIHDMHTIILGKERFTKYIGQDIKDFVCSLYLFSVPIARIHSLQMAMIIKHLDKKMLVTMRDYFLKNEDMRKICNLLQKDPYMKHQNNSESDCM